MNKCLTCGKATENKKFCNRSCSATYTNKKFPKRIKTVQICLLCGEKIERFGTESKFCSTEHYNEYKHFKYIEKWLSNYVSGGNLEHGKVSNHIRRYLLEKCHNACEKCGWSVINPFTNSIPLEVHHIDGNSRNNKRNNLVILCPNCHSLTKRTDIGFGRRYFRVKYREEENTRPSSNGQEASSTH